MHLTRARHHEIEEEDEDADDEGEDDNVPVQELL